MNFGSLFSGIGGFDLGFEQAGIKCLWQVEIDINCQNVLRRHFPDTEIYSDVQTVGRQNLKPVDLICGGFPCQDVSVAGRRKGLAGERSGLWFTFHRILAETQPGWVVIENVPGLLSSNAGRDFAVVLRGLVELGYGVCWRIFDAQYTGVAQRRRRLFVVASLGNGRSAEVLFERQGGNWDSPPSRETGASYPSTADGSSPVYSTETEVAAPIVERMHKGGFTDPLNDNIIAFTISQQDDGRNDGAGGMSIAQSEQSPTVGSKSKSVVVSSHSVFNSNEANSAGMRIQMDADVSVTLSGEGGGMSAKTGMYLLRENRAYRVRRLTPTECERLQGFPDGWTDGQSDTVRYRQLGNAVAVTCAHQIGRRIICLQSSPS